MSSRLLSLRFVWVIALLLGASSCTKSARDEKSVVSAEWLITAAELGANWSKQLEEEFSNRGRVPVIDEKSWCEEAVLSTKQLKDLAGTSGAIVSLKNSVKQGSSHTITEQVWQASGASEFVATFGEAVAMCDGKSWTTPENEKYSFASLDPPSFGDAVAAGSSTILTTEKDSTSEWVARMIAVRVGDVVVQMRELDVHPLGDEPALTVGEWNDTVRLAVQKVEKSIVGN